MAIVLLLSILAWAPLLYPGFIQTHSGLGAVYDALSVGGPFSGWLPAFGAPGDGPLASWLAAALQPLLGPLPALKLLFAAGFMLAGVGMYLLARRSWGEHPAFVAAAVYLFIPYRLAAVYVRGALAEALLLGLAPFLLLALSNMGMAQRRRNLLAIAFLTLVLVLLNAGIAVLVVALAIMWSATSPDVAGRAMWSATSPSSSPAPSPASPLPPEGKGGLWSATSPSSPPAPSPPPSLPTGGKGDMWSATSPDVAKSPIDDVWRRRTPHIAAAGAGVLAGLLVLLPAGRSMFPSLPGWSDHFVHLYQLFSPAWGFGESGPGWQDGLSFQIGLAPVGLTIAALWLACEGNDARLRRSVLSLCTLAGAPIVLSLTIAAPLWRIAPLSALVAYPWQLLGLAALPLALLAGAAAYALSRLPVAERNTHTRHCENTMTYRHAAGQERIFPCRERSLARRQRHKGVAEETACYAERGVPEQRSEAIPADSCSSEIASSLGSAPHTDETGESASSPFGDGRAERSKARPPDLGMTTLAVLLAVVVLASYGFLAPRFMNEADLPDFNHPPLAQLGGEVLLLDARVDGDLRPGGAVRLTLVWQALRQPSADYTIFVHMLDSQGAKVGQLDALPQQGARQTSGWQRGEVVRDEMSLPIAAGAPPGDYRLSVGMYLLATLERLPVAGTNDNAWPVGPVTIE